MNRNTIALSGLSDTDAAMFEAALGSLPTHPWKLVDMPPAALLVVDVDTVWGHMDWLRAVGSGQQVVAYSDDDHSHRDDLSLSKPLRTRDLADLLESVSPLPAKSSAPDTASVTATTAPDAAPAPVLDRQAPVPASPTPDITPVRTAPPEPSADPIPTPSLVAADTPTVDATPTPDLPLGECLLNGKLEHAVSIEADGVVLHLDPEHGGYTGSETLKPLRPLLDLPVKVARPLVGAALTGMRQATAMPLTRLLWFAALCATPGMLSPDLDPHADYHLTRWPQIEREFPRHFRIATSMMKGPGTLGDIASAANAPVGDVADFINAYSMAGYVSNSTPATLDTATDGDNKRMFSRLRRSLTRTPS